MRNFLTVVCILLGTVGCSEQQGQPKPPAAQPQEAAQNAITILQRLVNEQNYRSFGFESVQEVKEAQLGQPLSVAILGLEKLKTATPSTDANSLLTPSTETIYPVTVRGNVRSGVTIVHRQNGYEPASFGNAEVVRALSRFRSAEGAQNEFVLRVPALNLYYLAKRVDNRIMVIPIVEDPRLKMKVGAALSLESLVTQLRALAEGFNELPT